MFVFSYLKHRSKLADANDPMFCTKGQGATGNDFRGLWKLLRYARSKKGKPCRCRGSPKEKLFVAELPCLGLSEILDTDDLSFDVDAASVKDNEVGPSTQVFCSLLGERQSCRLCT